MPQIENRGEVTPLEIPEDSGLVEQTHIVFLEKNIVGCDFNFYGPRITRLPYYLAEKAVGVAPEFLNFNPLLRQDIFNQLKELKYLKLFDLKIRTSFVAKMREADISLSDAFRLASEAGNAEIVELILQPSVRQEGWLGSRLLESAIKLVQQKDFQYV